MNAKEIRCAKCGTMLGEEDGDGGLLLDRGGVAVLQTVKGLFICPKCGKPNRVEIGMEKYRRFAQMIVVDRDGLILAWTKEAYKIFGYALDDVAGKHINIIVPDDKRADVKTIVAKIRQTKRPVVFRTVRLKKDGTRFDCEIALKPLLGEDGSLIGMSRLIKAL